MYDTVEFPYRSFFLAGVPPMLIPFYYRDTSSLLVQRQSHWTLTCTLSATEISLRQSISTHDVYLLCTLNSQQHPLHARCYHQNTSLLRTSSMHARVTPLSLQNSCRRSIPRQKLLFHTLNTTPHGEHRCPLRMLETPHDSSLLGGFFTIVSLSQNAN